MVATHERRRLTDALKSRLATMGKVLEAMQSIVDLLPDSDPDKASMQDQVDERRQWLNRQAAALLEERNR
jgi:hypothetical protein